MKRCIAWRWPRAEAAKARPAASVAATLADYERGAMPDDIGRHISLDYGLITRRAAFSPAAALMIS